MAEPHDYVPTAGLFTGCSYGATMDDRCGRLPNEPIHRTIREQRTEVQRERIRGDQWKDNALAAERMTDMWRTNYHAIADLAEEQIDLAERYRLAWLSACKRAAELGRNVDELMDYDERMLADWAAECDRAERAEVRLAAVREYVDHPGNWSGLDGRRGHLLRLIDGDDTDGKSR